jgi:RNA polymerase sigma-70 factor (ECF subfamily)
MFAVPFPEIAQIVGASPAAARQLASRARRKVQGNPPDGTEDVARRRTVVLWSTGGRPRVAFAFTVEDGRITAIDLLADPDTLGAMDLLEIG